MPVAKVTRGQEPLSHVTRPVCAVIPRRLAFRLLAVVIVAAPYATALGAGTPPSASELAPIHGTYAPKIVPADFVATIDNRYLPFKPGTTFHYRGVRGTTAQRDDEVVTHQHK